MAEEESHRGYVQRPEESFPAAMQAELQQRNNPGDTLLNLMGQIIGSEPSMKLEEIMTELEADHRYQEILKSGKTFTDAELAEIRERAYEARARQMDGE